MLNLLKTEKIEKERGNWQNKILEDFAKTAFQRNPKLENRLSLRGEQWTCAICAVSNCRLLYAQDTVLHSQNCDICLEICPPPTAVLAYFFNCKV